jgi:hypothetical protein
VRHALSYPPHPVGFQDRVNRFPGRRRYGVLTPEGHHLACLAPESRPAAAGIVIHVTLQLARSAISSRLLDRACIKRVERCLGGVSENAVRIIVVGWYD